MRACAHSHNETGGCGFIGSNFINHVLDNHADVAIVNVDCMNYCAAETNVRPHPRYIFVRGNITDKDLILQLLREREIDTIVHFAAQSHVDNSLQYTIDDVLGTHTLLQASKEYGALKCFLHFSTDEVYGEVDRDHPGCHERSLLNPTNPYAAAEVSSCPRSSCGAIMYMDPINILKSSSLVL
jgi:UDP-glucose 4,6-dehydratase